MIAPIDPDHGTPAIKSFQNYWNYLTDSHLEPDGSNSASHITSYNDIPSVITSKPSKAQSAINIKKQRTKWAKDKGCPPGMAQLQMQFHSSAYQNQQKHLHTRVF